MRAISIVTAVFLAGLFALGLAACAVPNCAPGHLTCGVN